MADDVPGETITIQFDGLDADRNEIDLSDLAESLAGLSRILTVSGHFGLTGEMALQRRTLKVRTVAKAPQAGSFTVQSIIQFAHQHPLFGQTEVNVIAGLTVAAISYIFAKAIGDKREMQHLSGALNKAIDAIGARADVAQSHDSKTIDQLLATVDKMADKLLPAVRRSVAPVGGTARTLTVTADSMEHPVVIDEAAKAAIMSPAGLTVDDERSYEVLISELDMQTGLCHVALSAAAPEERIPAKITDPEVWLPNNPYVSAMASKTTIDVRAKATRREGEIERLFISNYAARRRGEPDFGLV